MGNEGRGREGKREGGVGEGIRGGVGRRGGEWGGEKGRRISNMNIISCHDNVGSQPMHPVSFAPRRKRTHTYIHTRVYHLSVL